MVVRESVEEDECSGQDVYAVIGVFGHQWCVVLRLGSARAS